MFRCSECGQFCRPVDEGIFYGSYMDLEPPEAQYFCKKCNRKFMAKAKKDPSSIITGCWWCKPKHVQLAIQRRIK
jgi:hypothetical protein